MNKYTPDYLIKKVFVQTRHLVYKWERGGKKSVEASHAAWIVYSRFSLWRSH